MIGSSGRTPHKFLKSGGIQFNKKTNKAPKPACTHGFDQSTVKPPNGKFYFNLKNAIKPQNRQKKHFKNSCAFCRFCGFIACSLNCALARQKRLSRFVVLYSKTRHCAPSFFKKVGTKCLPYLHKGGLFQCRKKKTGIILQPYSCEQPDWTSCAQRYSCAEDLC